MELKKIIILDFKTQEVLVYEYDENVWKDCVEFLESDEIGLNSNDCQWMVVDKLKIEIK